MNTKKLRHIKPQWFSTVDQGKQLELIATDSSDNEINGVPYPLATIKADEITDELLFEIHYADQAILIPVSQIKSAFDLARGEVHSEKWFEENSYPEKDSRSLLHPDKKPQDKP